MINTIFYYPESLAYDDYINMLNNGDISGRTIVFAKEQGNIYMGGKEYAHYDDTPNNKEYDPLHHSGLGKKTLELKDNNNILTQLDFDLENTVYVISYDFDLNGEDINIPPGSILEMNGGSFTNGRIISNDTEIIGIIPLNNGSFYGQFYHDGKPLDGNLKMTQSVSTCVDFAFMSPSEFTDYRFYPLSIAVFYYNNKKYYLLTGNIEGSDPERAFMVLFNKNFDFIGSTETPFPGHGGGLAVCDGKLYMGCNRNSESQYPQKMGIAVYNLSDVITFCTANKATVDTSVVYTKIQPINYIQLTDENGNPYNCADLSYDSIQEEFVVADGDFIYYIYDKNFNIKRYLHLETEKFLIDSVGYGGYHQGCTLKNGVLYGSFWASDYPATDRGNNYIFGYDTIKDKVVFTEYMPLPYAEAECEGLFPDPDNENNFYFLSGSNLSTGLNTIISIHRASKINSLFGLDSKKEGHAGIVNNMRSEYITVDNSYDFSNGTSDGSSDRPFKSIGSAIATMFARGDEYDIYIIATNKEYFLPYIRISNSTLVLAGIKKNVGGLDIYPTINGSVWSYGGSVRIVNLTLNTTTPVYTSGGGFLYLYNVTINGNTTGSKITGIRLSDAARVKLESVTIKDCSIGISSPHGDIEASSLTFDGCDYGIVGRMSTFGVDTLVVRNCTTGIKASRMPMDIGEASFTNVETCFYVDDSFINTYAPSSLTLDNITKLIDKDIDFKGRINLMCNVQTNEELAAFFDMIKAGHCNSTTVGFIVDFEGITYNDVPILKGTYWYNNPGFILEGYPHIMIREDSDDFVILPTSGTTAQRPVFDSTYALLYQGFQYFDTTIRRPVFWNGYEWYDTYTEERTWEKVGTLTSASTEFETLSVEATEDTYQSDWEGWTHAQDGTIYRTFITIDGNPFNSGDTIYIKLNGIAENTEWTVYYTDSSISETTAMLVPVLNMNTFNINKKVVQIPSGENLDKLRFSVRCDVDHFDGSIDVYKEV